MNTKTEMDKAKALHVIVDADRITGALAAHVKLFCIQNAMNISMQRIVGYCVPLSVYKKKCIDETPMPTRLIVPLEGIGDLDVFTKQYKFKFWPMFAEPLNAGEFQQMLKSVPSPLQSHHRVWNSSPICIRSDMEVVLSGRNRLRTVLKSFLHTFALHLNPHLIPFRLPNGAECYLLLDLAEHCRGPYDRRAEPEFGHYHSRELQIEDARERALAAYVETDNRRNDVHPPAASPSAGCSKDTTEPQQALAASGDADRSPNSRPFQTMTYAQVAANGRKRTDLDTGQFQSVFFQFQTMTYAQVAANGRKRTELATGQFQNRR